MLRHLKNQNLTVLLPANPPRQNKAVTRQIRPFTPGRYASDGVLMVKPPSCLLERLLMK